MKNTFIAPFFLALFLSFSCLAQQQENPADRYRGVEVGTETRVFTSAINNVAYKFLINLPANYREEPSKEYPVCYVLDGQWSFSNVASSYWDLHWDGVVPDMIIVGLTYDGADPDYKSLRFHDYSPTPLPQFPGSGGADDYIEVLRKEVIPFIDKEYRTNKVDRAITGNSLAGLFTYYALFKAPELFNGYVPINPSLWWDDMKPFEFEEEFAQNRKQLDARLFAVSGEFDAVELFNKMVDQIQSHQYEGLALESRILEGMGHSGSKSEGYARGLKYLYERQAIKLSDAELEQYAGTYEINPENRFHMIVNNGELLVNDLPGSPEIRVFSVGNNEFSTMGSYLPFEFLRDEEGNVTGFKGENPGDQLYEVKKVE